MIRGVLISVVLSGILIFAVLRVAALYEDGIAIGVTRIDIYADRITYRTGSYATPTLLEIGLRAANDPPQVLALHDCARQKDFESVVGVLRRLDYLNIEIQMPDDC